MRKLRNRLLTQVLAESAGLPMAGCFIGRMTARHAGAGRAHPLLFERRRETIEKDLSQID